MTRRLWEELGISNIIILKGKPLYKLVGSIDYKEVAVLTDLDEGRKEVVPRIKAGVSERVMINDRLNIVVVKTQLRQIEAC